MAEDIGFKSRDVFFNF